MDSEDRSSSEHRAWDVQPQSSSDPAEPVVGAVGLERARPAFRSRFGLGLGTVAVVGVILALALVAVPIAFGPTATSTASPPAGTPVPPSESARATASSTPTPTSTSGEPGLAHYSNGGITFDYPASWHPSGQVLNQHYITILGYIGTGNGNDYCQQVTPGPGDSFIGGAFCTADEPVEAGQVLVKILTQDGPPSIPPVIDPADPSGLVAGQRYVTVGGVPAIFTEQGTASHPLLTWEISMPGGVWGKYRVQAEMRDPGVAGMRAQVEALIATVGFDPPVPVLNPADGPKIAAIAIAKEKADKQILACFPSEPGASASETIDRVPTWDQPLARPLPVTCSTAIEPLSIGLWKLTLTMSWTAATDREAGSTTTIVYVDPDGTPGTMIGLAGGIPYLP